MAGTIGQNPAARNSGARAMQALTDLADLAVLLPIGLCVAVWLWAGGWGRGAVLWLAGLAAVLGFMLAAKLALLGCARPGAALASPSGHTAAAGYVYGGAAALAMRWRARWACVAAAAIAALIGLSRIAVHAHSLAEVMVGGMVGVAALAAFIGLAGAAPPGLRPMRLVLCAVPLIVVLHGARLNMEPHVRLAALRLGWCL